jgi:flagellar L-ring protein FlgH
MMSRAFLALPLLLAACTGDIEEIGVAPSLSPTGSGIADNHTDMVAAALPVAEPTGDWAGGNADLFRDQKARRPGDIVTVLIDIDDKASLNNNSNRSRKSKTDASLGLSYSLLGVVGMDTKADGDVDSNTTSSGQGATVRAEKVRVSIAAVVSGVLPNGLLVIQGSQEVLVNFEARVLTITGLVHPKDITGANRIPYDKIAEVRISYGGKGRLSEVQQPGWGQQIWDRVSPF